MSKFSNPPPTRPTLTPPFTFSRLLASASLATDTRAYPWSFPLIFHWPTVLA